MSKASKKPDRGGKPAHTSMARTGAHAWQLQTAKPSFSEVFRLARTEGPERITRQGKEGVIMISDERYDRLTLKSHQPKGIEFFRESPLLGVDIDLERVKDAGRDIEL